MLNNNLPNFNEYDIANISGESYAELDESGRCGTAVACIESSMMPAQDRGYIGMIKPSGWSQAKYEGLVDSDPPYLFNRCHLIAYALTGQNSNERNLITRPFKKLHAIQNLEKWYHIPKGWFLRKANRKSVKSHELG